MATCEFWNTAAGTEFAIGRISMVANTGSYIDTPAHRFRDGNDLSALLWRAARCCPPRWSTATGPSGPRRSTASRSTGAPFCCAPGGIWGTEQYGAPEHPHLTEAGAQHLVDRGAALVGTDSLNIDDTRTGERPAHTVLLSAEVPVVEHLTGLNALPATGARFTAVPPAVRGMATFPVRAFAIAG